MKKSSFQKLDKIVSKGKNHFIWFGGLRLGIAIGCIISLTQYFNEAHFEVEQLVKNLIQFSLLCIFLGFINWPRVVAKHTKMLKEQSGNELE